MQKISPYKARRLQAPGRLICRISEMSKGEFKEKRQDSQHEMWMVLLSGRALAASGQRESHESQPRAPKLFEITWSHIHIYVAFVFTLMYVCYLCTRRSCGNFSDFCFTYLSLFHPSTLLRLLSSHFFSLSLYLSLSRSATNSHSQIPVNSLLLFHFKACICALSLPSLPPWTHNTLRSITPFPPSLTPLFIWASFLFFLSIPPFSPSPSFL